MLEPRAQPAAEPIRAAPAPAMAAVLRKSLLCICLFFIKTNLQIKLIISYMFISCAESLVIRKIIPKFARFLAPLGAKH